MYLFCEKCGSRLETGDHFCPICGNKIEAWQVASPCVGNRVVHTIQKKPDNLADAAKKALPKHTGKIRTEVSDVLSRLILSSMGFFILAWTFFPFVSIQTGELVRMAGAILGRSIGNFGVNLYGIKATVSGLSKFVNADAGNCFRGLNTVITMVIVAVLAVSILAMLSGLVNRKIFIMISGISSTICLIMFLAYIIYVDSIIDQVNEYLREQAIIKGFHGIGMILMLITLAAHAFLAIRKAISMQ